ncbi:hypothetical protein [Marinifilum sp. D737]|uniref:hypothetical protein n=1 Tax=Marinifilum sp. D737 TaxID=2969628 RepID=UPI00227640DA|nr:hypothetical protein [Marinifilum sp. D737]MCY1634816.1 hypothetical protein [Marinifilum sp. D737]
MKNICRIFLFAIIFGGCNTAKQTSNPKPQIPISNHDKKVKQIAPATCLLTVTLMKNSFDTKTIKAKVIKIHGYGSGFTRSFNANQEIVLNLSDKHLKEIKNYETISCVISQVTTMNNNSYLKLIEIKQ